MNIIFAESARYTKFSFFGWQKVQDIIATKNLYFNILAQSGSLLLSLTLSVTVTLAQNGENGQNVAFVKQFLKLYCDQTD